VEKGIDVMLATDLLHFAWNGLYDIAVLVSGDSDFAYALQAVKNMGKHVEVAYFEANVGKDLLDIADNRHLLNQRFFKGLWTGKRPPPPRKVPTEVPFGAKEDKSSGGQRRPRYRRQKSSPA
jgi:uncharacterized LabA/DUF88 family protein